MDVDVTPTAVASNNQPVARCLLGRASATDRARFTACVTHTQNQAVRRFCQRWGWEDSAADDELREPPGRGGGGAVEEGASGCRWVRIRSMSESDLNPPAFYSRGYSHARSRRRPLGPSAGKRLTFEGDGPEEGGGGRGRRGVCSPVQYRTDSSRVEMFLGLPPLPPPPPSPPASTLPPIRSALSADCLVPAGPCPASVMPSPFAPLPPIFDPTPPSSLPRPTPQRQAQWAEHQPSSSSLPPSSSSSLLSQARTTDGWRGRKRWGWERPPSPGSEDESRKRERLDGL